MNPITSKDHIRGNPDAPVKIVEYSDTECPFCKRFHPTMQQVMDEYGGSGQVAWVYRHFPLDSLHKKARKEAEATECAAEQGGNDKFWSYLDRLMEVTPANDGLDPAELPKIAQYVGLDVTKFNECLSSGRFADKVEEDTQNAMATGGNGTPWSIVVGKDGKKYPLSGAQPYASIKQLIDIASK
jgi:protein-disulfide isomerase